jgi:hypothetical protein
MPHISAAAQRHDDVLFLGVAVSDDEAAAASFAAEIDVAYALGFDPAGMVDAHYPAPGLPATFLISGGGDIVGTFIGQMHPDVIEQLVADLRSE